MVFSLRRQANATFTLGEPLIIYIRVSNYFVYLKFLNSVSVGNMANLKRCYLCFINFVWGIQSKILGVPRKLKMIRVVWLIWNLCGQVD